MRLRILCWLGLGWIALLPLLSVAAPSTHTSDPRREILAQILAQKAQGEVDPALYVEYFGDQTRYEGNPLDQGGETFASATIIPALPYNDNGTTAIAVHNYDTNFGGCPVSTAKDVVYRYTPLVGQQVAVELCGSSYDTKLMVYENNSATPVACNDDACDLSSRVSVAMSPPNIYYIVVDGFDVSSFGPYVLVVHEDSPCDVVIPPDALHECAFEEINPSHAKKDCNGGCNNETVDGLYDLDRYDGICSGSMVAGECFTYLDEEGFNLRDTDWFLFKMETTGPVNLTAQTEFDASVGIVNLNNCVSPSFVDFTTTPPCTPAALSIPSLDPGTYAAFIAPSGFSAVETPKEYLLQIVYPTRPSPCSLPNQEIEPNDDIAHANAIPGPMVTMGGDISCPMDGDYFSFQMPYASAIRLHLRGNAAVGFCPEGQGLHPYCEIVNEIGDPIILAGDQTNLSTTFETDFKLGPYRYYFGVGGANHTTGPYEIEIELIQLSLVSCEPLTVTLHAEGGGVNLRWYGATLPTDQIQVYKQLDPNGALTPYAVVPAFPPSFFDPGSEPFAGYAVRVLGGCDAEFRTPWIGSLLGLGEETGPDGEYNEIGEYTITNIEWAVDQNNICVQTRLRAEGTGVVGGELIDQNRRAMLDQGWQAISSFQGHYISVNERKVLVDHVAYVRDPVQGDVGIVDGRGWNETGDTLLFLNNLQVYLHGNLNPVSEPWFGWNWWWWWDDFFCPGTCCRLKTIAFCTSTGSPTPPGCFTPFPLMPCPCNPSCWLGCPCPPDPPPPDPANCCGPSLPPAPATHPFGCDGCTFRVSPVAGWFVRYCQCPSDTTPPVLPFCMFMIYVKCKSYCPCPDIFNICGCEVPICPGPFPGAPPDTWINVPFSGPAMKAFCRKECKLFGPGC